MKAKLSPRGNWVLANTKPGKVLHVGFAGSGDQPDTLFQKTRESFPQSQIFGVDINAKKVKKLALPNTQVADGRKLPFGTNSFDCVVLAEVLEHQLEVYPFLTEAYRVLKGNGVFLVTTPNPYGLFRWLKHFLLTKDVSSKKNIRNYLGDPEHQVFSDPLSLINLLYFSGFSKVTFETTNPSYPYLPEVLKERLIPLSPFNKLGTYSCLKAVK